jgi:hypothetical protein
MTKLQIPNEQYAFANFEWAISFVISPELAGIRARILSLQAADWISRAVLAPLSLPRKIAFPDSGDRR